MEHIFTFIRVKVIMINLIRAHVPISTDLVHLRFITLYEPIFLINPFMRNVSIGRVHFQFWGCRVVFFIFIQILKEFSVSKLVLHCLQMSRKKDTRLILVNMDS